MAGIKLNQRSAVPKTGVTGGGGRPSKLTLGVLVASILAAVWAVAMLTPSGRVAYVYTYFFVDYFAGVFTLVSLSITVMIGLLATDRIVLKPPHRVLVQAAHRTTGTLAVGFLVLHILTQVALGRVSAVDVLIPFLGGLYIGFGTVAGLMMAGVLWTGFIRSRFLGGKPWMWRALHSVAYASWPIALVHGLNAGRPAAGWVMASYFACVGLVGVALLVRFSLNYGRRDPFIGSVAGGAQSAARPAAEPSTERSRPRRPRGGEVRVEPAASRYAEGRATADVVDSWSSPGDYRRREVAATRSGRYRVPAVPTPEPEPERPVAEGRRRRAESDRPTVAVRRGGRHSRDEEAVLADPVGYAGDDYLPPDDTPTLVDLASRRARRAESGAAVGRVPRRRRAVGDDADLEYWSRLRGEAR